MRGRANFAASPTMVGALTVMVVVLAVFLAYNANNGLPFVPSYRISADVPNADLLVPTNEVRIGGVRVGVIEAIEPQQAEDGEVTARLDLKLDRDVEELPVDSTMIVRARSALGLKYLEINQGSSDEGFPAGSVIPLSSAQPEPVDIDEVLSTFDRPTQVAIREGLFEFGNALAGRGPDLNEALGRLPGVLEHLEPVMTNLSNPETGLGRFVTALAATASEVAPVAEIQAQLFVDLDTTFTSLAEVARPFIQETISESPPTLDAGTQALPVVRPFLAHSATLFNELQPGVETLAATAPILTKAVQTGTPALRNSPQLNRELASTAEALERFNDDTGVRNGIARLNETVNTLAPFVSFVTPAQTVCNYGSLLFRNFASSVSQGSDRRQMAADQRFRAGGGPQQRGHPVLSPCQRRRHRQRQLPSLQPVSEHGRAGPDV